MRVDLRGLPPSVSLGFVSGGGMTTTPHRRARGCPFYAAPRSLGRRGAGNLVEGFYSWRACSPAWAPNQRS